MPRPAAIALSATALVLLAGGCGSASTPRPTTAPRSREPVAAQGRQVFASSCGACHGLSGAESPRLQGGDLAAFSMTEAQLESETRVMPVRRPLTDAQVRAVSQYILAVQRAYAARAGHR